MLANWHMDCTKYINVHIIGHACRFTVAYRHLKIVEAQVHRVRMRMNEIEG